MTYISMYPIPVPPSPAGDNHMPYPYGPPPSGNTTMYYGGRRPAGLRCPMGVPGCGRGRGYIVYRATTLSYPPSPSVRTRPSGALRPTGLLVPYGIWESPGPGGTEGDPEHHREVGGGGGIGV